MAKKKLYLIDGANYVFRAYYALPGMSNSKGFPTNALYGYTQMLLKLLKDEKPDYIAVCFDCPEPTFRDELYGEYKANRKEPPDDLKEQFPLVGPLTEALGIKAIYKPGFEADDIIGTIAKDLSGECDVVIVSGDKDLMQLVDDGITILDQMKGKRIGEAEVRERFGVGPEGVVHVLGLAGDASDNIPGVPGVGIKTAMKLISEYETVLGVIEHVDDIKGAMGRNIRDNVEKAKLSLQLVQIDTQVPLKYSLKEFVRGELGGERTIEMFKNLEFSRLIDEFPPSEVAASLSYDKYILVDEENALDNLSNTLNNKDILSIDLETTSLNTMQAKIVGLSLAWAPGEAAYIPVGHIYGKCVSEAALGNFIRPILADENIKLIGQNLNYDLTILKNKGFEVRGIYFDTMIASYLLHGESGNSLDSLSARHLDHRTIKYEEVVGKGKSQKNFSEIMPLEARDYAAEDADVALRLYEKFKARISDGYEKLFFDMEMPLIEVLVDMQFAGMKVDKEMLGALDKDFGSRIACLEKEIYSQAGEEFNVSSPKQLGVILFEKLGLPVAKKTKTGYSTSQDILENLSMDHDLPKLVLEYRSLSKLKSTYVDALRNLIDPNTGRVHTSFNQARTATGRLSSSDPNMQNIPIRTEEGRKIREAFIAEDGFTLMSADYSQIELRILAHMSGEQNLIDAFAENLDVHAITASGIFGVRVRDVTREQRAVGKTVNFATLYGQGAFGLSKQLSISPGEASEYISNYFNKYPRVAGYREEVLKAASDDGYVTTLFGRRRYLPDINSKNKQLVQIAERMAFNTVFQGTAADIIKKAMIEIHRELPEMSAKTRMLLQVHDELVFEVLDADVEKVRGLVKRCMEGVTDLKVPLIVDIGIGPNWALAH